MPYSTLGAARKFLDASSIAITRKWRLWQNGRRRFDSQTFCTLDPAAEWLQPMRDDRRPPACASGFPKRESITLKFFKAFDDAISRGTIEASQLLYLFL
jgi:hypothetical protein